jgi:NAD(P)-dependent dehydrogenase (short-subunit alcohol dehydrogenase family)
MIADLTGKVAVVTGGASGIGAGICTVLAEQGAFVTVADIDLRGAEKVVSELPDGRGSAMRLDVTDQGSVDDMVRALTRDGGRIDILVNNAGVIGAPGWWERDRGNDDDWQRAFEVNVRGVVRCSEAVSPHMIERGYGKQVNIASIAARRGGEEPYYCVTKAAVMNWTQSSAAALARHGINVNAICPGLVWTPMTSALVDRRANFALAQSEPGMRGKEAFDAIVDSWVPMGREQTARDIGKAAAFLASDDAQNITGQAVNVDGGIYMN